MQCSRVSLFDHLVGANEQHADRMPECAAILDQPYRPALGFVDARLSPAAISR
jgi:hypothetical protein